MNKTMSLLVKINAKIYFVTMLVFSRYALVTMYEFLVIKCTIWNPYSVLLITPYSNKVKRLAVIDKIVPLRETKVQNIMYTSDKK